MEHQGTIHKSGKPDESVWRIAARQDILWRNWDGDYVVFGSLSGETHILDIVSGKALERIMERPSSVPEIRSDIADFLEVENDEELASAVAKILQRLEDAALIEPKA